MISPSTYSITVAHYFHEKKYSDRPANREQGTELIRKSATIL